MAKHSAKERAAALLASPAAIGQPDFALRAAACHALGSIAYVPGFDPVSVWPGQLNAFERLGPAEHASLAAELLALHLREPPDAAA